MKGYELLLAPSSRLFSSFLWILSLVSPFKYSFFKWRLWFFRAVLGLQQNGEEDTEIFYRPSASTHAQPPPVSTSPTRVVHLLQLMNLPWHNITTQSSKFTLGLTLSVVHSMDLCKCIMTSYVSSVSSWLNNSYLSQFSNISLSDTGSFIHSHTEGHLVASKLWKWRIKLL